MKKSYVAIYVIVMSILLWIITAGLLKDIGFHDKDVFWIFAIPTYISIILAVLGTKFVLMWDCNYTVEDPISIESRKYLHDGINGSYMEIIINGNQLFRYGKSDEMYELILLHGLKKVFISQPINIFGIEIGQYDLIVFPDQETMAVVYQN